MIKRLGFVPMILLLALTGCKDPYGACAKAGADVGSAITQGFSTVTALEQEGQITPAEALNVAGYLKFANDGDKAFISCVGFAHTNGNKPGTYTSCAQTFNAALNTPAEVALIHVGNAKAQQTITVIVNGLTAGATAIVSGLGGA